MANPGLFLTPANPDWLAQRLSLDVSGPPAHTFRTRLLLVSLLECYVCVYILMCVVDNVLIGVLYMMCSVYDMCICCDSA